MNDTNDMNDGNIARDKRFSFSSFAFVRVIPVVLGVCFSNPSAQGATPQAGDPAALVAAARQALGGDSILSAISSLTITGSISQDLGPVSTSSSFETTWVAPDKFIRISRRTSGGGPMAIFQISDFEGFRGDAPFRETVAPDAPFPMVIPTPAPATPEEVSAAKARRLEFVRALFFESLIPLVVTPAGPWGLQVGFAGTAVIDKKPADALDIKSVDGRAFRLFLDAQTHLPVRLIWKDKPIVTMSSTTLATTQVIMRPTAAGSEIVSPLPDPIAIAVPKGDPTANLPFVLWEMSIENYKIADGVNWPRRFRTSYAGNKWQDIRISRYRLNPTIDDKVFDRRK
jgi:hypothetical protein